MLLRSATLLILLISSTSCNTFRFNELRFKDEPNNCWYRAKDETCINVNEPIIFEEYALIRQDELIHLYEDYVCKLKESANKD